MNNNMSRVVKKNIWQDLSQYSLSLQNKIVTFVKDISFVLQNLVLTHNTIDLIVQVRSRRTALVVDGRGTPISVDIYDIIYEINFRCKNLTKNQGDTRLIRD